MADYYPETESWILRNLTTAEFVQGDKLLHSVSENQGLSADPILDILVLARRSCVEYAGLQMNIKFHVRD